MKARIKTTGEVVDIIAIHSNGIEDGKYRFHTNGTFEYVKEIDIDVDWEERAWNAAVAIMASIHSDSNTLVMVVSQAEKCGVEIEEYLVGLCARRAKALVEEYKKEVNND